MSKHYNIVVSYNFKDEKTRNEYRDLVKSLGYATVLYTGVHDGEVYQKVTTQKCI